MFTDLERARIRDHLGYPNVNAVQTFMTGGLTAPIETSFVIEGAMNRVMPEAEALIRTYLTTLDGLEQQLIDDAPNFAAKKVGTIEVNLEEQNSVLKLYTYWRSKIANTLGVDANPFDRRFGGALAGGGAGGINIRVIS